MWPALGQVLYREHVSAAAKGPTPTIGKCLPRMLTFALGHYIPFIADRAMHAGWLCTESIGRFLYPTGCQCSLPWRVMFLAPALLNFDPIQEGPKCLGFLIFSFLSNRNSRNVFSNFSIQRVPEIELTRASLPHLRASHLPTPTAPPSAATKFGLGLRYLRTSTVSRFCLQSAISSSRSCAVSADCAWKILLTR